jgi:Transposase, Mutator family
MAEWRNRPLDYIHPMIFVGCINVEIRDGQVANRPIYMATAVTCLRGSPAARLVPLRRPPRPGRAGQGAAAGSAPRRPGKPPWNASWSSRRHGAANTRRSSSCGTPPGPRSPRSSTLTSGSAGSCAPPTRSSQSVNDARIRRAVRVRGHFPSEQAALTCVHLAVMSLEPHRDRPETLDQPVESRPERPRDHLRRTSVRRPEVEPSRPGCTDSFFRPGPARGRARHPRPPPPPTRAAHPIHSYYARRIPIHPF